MCLLNMEFAQQAGQIKFPVPWEIKQVQRGRSTLSTTQNVSPNVYITQVYKRRNSYLERSPKFMISYLLCV